MKKYSAIVIILIISWGLMVYNAYKTDSKLKERDDRIKELDQQVWQLKLDTMIQNRTAQFQKKLDSIFKP